MNLAPFFLVVLLAVAASQPVVRAEAPQKGAVASAATPEDTIRAFYRWYIVAVASGKEPLTQNTAEMKRYVSERLLKEINRMAKGPDGLDGDYFLDAQDFDKAWASHMTVGKVVVNGTHAEADVVLTSREMGKKQLHVTLVQERGGWKMDKVRG